MMSEGSVLQHLVTEHIYRKQIPKCSEKQDMVAAGNDMYSSSFQARRKECDRKAAMVNEANPTAPRRALSDDQPCTQPHSYMKTSSRSAESPIPQFTQSSKPLDPPSMSQISQTSGLISRLRQEFLNKPSSISVKNGASQGSPQTEANRATIKPISAPVPRGGTPTPSNAFSRTIASPSPSSDKHRFHGHPKSNSAGEEFLYTDRKAMSSNKGRRHRGKSTATVARSQSLHHYDCSHQPGQSPGRRAHTDLGLGTQPFVMESCRSAPPRKQSDTSTLSSGSFGSENQSSSVSSFNAENYFQINTAEESNQGGLSRFGNSKPATTEGSSNQYQLGTNLSSMVVTPSGMGGSTQPPMSQPGPHGPFYATVPTNPMGHHIMGQRHSPPPPHHPPSQQTTTSPPRGPPPPYPQGTSFQDSGVQPQRPNSLALSGKVSRKKMEYGSPHNSPALTSPGLSNNPLAMNFPTYALSAGTPVGGTSFHAAFTQDFQATTTTAGSNNSALHGYPTNAISQPPKAKFTRSGSGGIGHNFHPNLAMVSQHKANDQQCSNGSTSTSLSSSSSSTVIGTPGSYAPQRFDTVPPMRNQTQPPNLQTSSTSPSHGQHHTTQPASNFNEYAVAPAGYSAVGGSSGGYSLGKSDSNASTSSSGSRIARRAKRNSKNYSNASGSSSSTGNSRPNSSADLLEKTMSENEMLRTQLQNANQKLNKFQNIEKEFLRIKDEYQALHTSAAKSEKLEHDLRTRLEASNRRTQQENDILRERIKTLTELVETLQSSNKDAQTTSNSDIMMYKVKVKEYQNREKTLSEQLDETNERISEQQEDISLLSSSLEKSQNTIASLKEKLLKKQTIERYVDELSPLLEMLLSTVKERLQIESELEVIVKSNQRKSTSSNDEGISEMDAGEGSQSQGMYGSQNVQVLNADENVVRTKAQMLKWQHMYLEATLMRELTQSSAEDSKERKELNRDDQNAVSPLFNMLYRHRHAASDPIFSKNLPSGKFNWEAAGLGALFTQNQVQLRRDGDGKKRGTAQRRDKSSTEPIRSSPRKRRETASTSGLSAKNDCASPVENPSMLSRSNANAICNDEDSAMNVSQPVSSEKTTDGKLVNENEMSSTATEFDSPSEGYHSQQSSGSPTPSSERSSLHFPEGDTRVTAALAPLQDVACAAPMPLNNSLSARPPLGPSSNNELYLLGSKTGSAKKVLTKVGDV